MATGNAGMEKLIPMVNELQNVCIEMGTTLQIDLPQIAVIGSQGAGKSSVLENFVGREILPRGTGIVTRRPLILQLINAKEEYGVFQHKKNEKFTNFHKIRDEIEAETIRLVGNSERISNELISLRIFSPNVLDLTLIDLPGMTRIPVGEQPPDIGEQIKEMILGFIRQKNCLILAVSPANYEATNSDALTLAREVDPEGLRTYGVITQLDLMNPGTDARKMLDGKIVPLRRGYIGVVNRSQADIDGNKDMAKALEDERAFFKNHEAYCDIAHRSGTKYLQEKLNREFIHHIRDTLPSLETETRTKMESLEGQMCIFKELYPNEASDVKIVKLKVIRQFQSDFNKEIGSLGSKDVDTDRLTGGTTIRGIFHERFPEELSKIKYDKKELRQRIATAINNLYGKDVISFTPFKAIETIVREQVSNLKEPIIKCIDLVVEELSKIVEFCTQRIRHYPSFRGCIEGEIMSFIHEHLPNNKKSVLSLVEMELGYMNLEHEEFKNNKRNKMAKEVAKNTAPVYDALSINHSIVGMIVNKLVKGVANLLDTQSDVEESDGGESAPKVLREGMLDYVFDDGDEKTGWFSLVSGCLSCFDKDDHKLETFTLSVRGSELLADFTYSKPTITLSRTEYISGSVNQGFELLKLSCGSVDDLRSWDESITNAIEMANKPVDMKKLNTKDTNVEQIYNGTSAYMRIVNKTMCDMIPKAINLFIIQKLEEFIEINLHIKIPDDDKHLEMLKASDEDAERNLEVGKMYEACEKVLGTISSLKNGK